MVRRKTLRVLFTLMFSFSMVMGGLPGLPIAAAEDVVPPSLETAVSPDAPVVVDVPADPLPADPVVVDGDVGGALPPADPGTEVPLVEEPVVEAPAAPAPAPEAAAPAPITAPSLLSAPALSGAIEPLSGTGPVDGAIDVTKTVLDSAGNPVDMDTLPDDYEFVVNIDGPGHDFDVVAHLNAGNDWTERFDPMHHGDYKVTENYPDYDLYGVLIDGVPDYSAPFAFELEESGHYTLPDGRPLGKVEIINKHVPDGELEISKEFHSFAGVPIEPMEGAEVTFNVTGPEGYDETFVLSDDNGWSKLLEGLVTGDYVISEESIEGFTACYMLEDEMLDLPATVHVDDGGSAAITICNMADPDGRLDIEKTFETFMGIPIDPPEDFEIVLNVTGPEDFDETFTLSEAMGWSKSFDGLYPGEYVISEEAVDGYTASYWLDDVMLDLPATVMVEDRADTSVTVLNTADADGRLDIEKTFETFTGIPIDPPEDFEIVLNVTGPEDFDETFTLSEAMGWSKSFDGLLPGDYVISEEGIDGFTASYWLDDVMLELPATVDVEDRATTSVTILNTADPDGRLDISKEFETFTGLPIDPPEDFEIVLNVTGPEEFDETFTLSEADGWSKSFDGLLPGEYVITEEEVDGFTASYWLGDEALDLPATVMVEDREATSVTVLNTADADGRLDIEKVFETFVGVPIEVAPEDFEIVLNVTGPEEFDETFALSEADGWSKSFDGLIPGEYVITEEAVDGFTASYWLDDEMLELPATVMVEDRATTSVTVLNTADADGRLQVTKEYRTAAGLPATGAAVSVQVTGPEDFDETFTLNADNEWMMVFEGLLPGDYTIHEVTTGDFKTTYEFEGLALDTPVVEVTDREMTEVVVVNTLPAPAPPVEQYTVDKVASVTTAKIGDTITYTVTVKNTGEIAIANKPISDTLVPSLPVTGTPTIQPGASWTFSYTYKVPATFTGTNLVNVVKVGDITDTVTVPITPTPLKTGDDLRMAFVYGMIALVAGATALTARRRRGVVRTK